MEIFRCTYHIKMRKQTINLKVVILSNNFKSELITCYYTTFL